MHYEEQWRLLYEKINSSSKLGRTSSRVGDEIGNVVTVVTTANRGTFQLAIIFYVSITIIITCCCCCCWRICTYIPKPNLTRLCVYIVLNHCLIPWYLSTIVSFFTFDLFPPNNNNNYQNALYYKTKQNIIQSTSSSSSTTIHNPHY